MSSWWTKAPRDGFTKVAETIKFNPKVSPTVFTQPHIRRRRKFTEAQKKNSYQIHKDSVIDYQRRLIEQGLCESGDGNRTEMNKRTGRHYRRCAECSLKRQKYDKGRIRSKPKQERK